MVDSVRRLVRLDKAAKEGDLYATRERDALALRIGPTCARLLLRLHEGLREGYLDTAEDRAAVLCLLESDDPATTARALAALSAGRPTGHRLALAYEPGPEPPFSILCLHCTPRWLLRLPVDPTVDAVLVARAAHEAHVRGRD